MSLQSLKEAWRTELAFAAPSEPIDSCNYPDVIVSETIEAESSPTMLLEIRKGTLGVISSIMFESRFSPYLTATEVLFGSDSTEKISTELFKVRNDIKFRECEKQNEDISPEPQLKKSAQDGSQHRESFFLLCIRKALNLVFVSPAFYHRGTYPKTLCKFRARCCPGKYCQIQIRGGTEGLLSRLTIVGMGEDSIIFYPTKAQTEALVRTFAKFHDGDWERKNVTSGA
jgi:hypothetical protein